MTSADDSVGIYVHVPYCQARCSYCAFYTRPWIEADGPGLAAALAAEMRRVACQGRTSQALRLPPQGGRRVDTVYIGGGTPSLLEAEDLSLVLQETASSFELDAAAEITLEANPETVTSARALAWRRLGINRVSLGAQSFDAATLRSLGRLHGPGGIATAVQRLRAAGFDNLNLDLIAGVHPAGLDDDLDAALSLQPEHISLYLLEVDEMEVGGVTPLARQVAAGRRLVPDEDWYAEAYPRAVRTLSRAGLRRYEICNFAQLGHQCHHNLRYWHSQEVLGFGPAAHSLSGNHRYAVEADLGAYLNSNLDDLPPNLVLDDAGEPARGAESIILSLRLEEGLDRRGPQPGHAWSQGEERLFRELQADGLMVESGGRLRLSGRGILLSNEVFQRFLPEVEC